MSNKASSALQALTLLGNTFRGVNAQQLRILYLGCVLPILIWGCEIWFQGKRDKGRLKPLQRVERQGLLRITGAWKPSPSLAQLTPMAGVLPLQLLVARRRAEYACRRRWGSILPIPASSDNPPLLPPPHTTSLSERLQGDIPHGTELFLRNIVSSYEANEVLTPTVPKQQWRPVSENELAYTAASAQCWVHA